MNFVQGHVECASSSAWRYITHGQIWSMLGWRIQLRVRFFVHANLTSVANFSLPQVALNFSWGCLTPSQGCNEFLNCCQHWCRWHVSRLFQSGSFMEVWNLHTSRYKEARVCVFVKILFLCFGLSDALSFQWHELLWSWQHSWASVSDCFDAVSFWWCELSWSW